MKSIHHKTSKESVSRWRLIGERGTALVEYGLLVGLIAIGSMATITAVSEALDDDFNEVAMGLESSSTDTESDEGEESSVTTTTLAGGSGGSDSSDEEAGDGGDGSATTTTTSTTLPAGDGDDDDDDDDGDDDGDDNDDGDDDDDDGDDDDDDGDDDGDDDDDDGDDDDDDDGDDNDGDDDGDEAQKQAFGVSRGFTGTFVVDDDTLKVVDLELNGWTYKTTKDKDDRIHMTFTDKGSKRTVQVKGWLTGKGELKTQVKEKSSKR